MLGIQNYWMRRNQEQALIEEARKDLERKPIEVLQKYVNKVESKLKNRSLICEIWQLYSLPTRYIAAKRILERQI